MALCPIILPSRNTVPLGRLLRDRLSGHARQVLRPRLAPQGVVARCISEGLVGGHGFGVDASLIKAVVHTVNSSAQAEPDVSAIAPSQAPRAVREYLDGLDDRAFGASTPVKRKVPSHSDPASQLERGA